MIKVISWDEPKRLYNLAKHKLDFADFEAGFDLNGALVLTAKEGRNKVIGLLNGETVAAAIVVALGAEALALISLRPASKKERELWQAR